jgi:fibronectin-binding autotransporter adhesin
MRRQIHALHSVAAAMLAAIVAVGGGPHVARAADVTFESIGGDWSNTENWSGGSLPTASDIAIFSADNGNATIYLEGNRGVSGLRFTNTGTTDLFGSAGTEGTGFILSLGSGGIVISPTAGVVAIGGSTGTSPAAPQRIGLALTADQTWTNNNTASSSDTVTFFRGQGNPTPGSNLDLGTHTLTMAGAGVTELRGGSIGSGRIVKQGTGTLLLGNDKTFTGGVQLDVGALGIINGATPLGTGTLTINGGTIFPSAATRTLANAMVWGGDFQMRHPSLSLDSSLGHSLSITGDVLLTGNRTVTVNNGTSSVSGAPNFLAVGTIGDGGSGYSLSKAGPGTLVLLGDNTYTGGTTVSAGTLQLGNGGATGSVPGDIAINGSSTRLVIDRNSGLVYGGVISGDGSIVKNGIGGLTLTGANTYTGTLTVNAGALGIDSVASLPGWDTAGRYSIGASAAITFGGGVTEAQISTIFATGNVDPAAGTGFDTTGGNQTFSGNLATAFGTRNIAKTGPNTLILDGQSTNNTTFSIAGGLVQAGSAQTGSTSGPLGLGSIVFAGGTLQYSAANQADYSSRFTDAAQIYAVDTNGQNVTWSRVFSLGNNGGISKSGAGTLTLTGGSVTMAASQLSVSGGTLSAPGVILTSTTPAVLDVTGGGRLELGGINRDPTNVNQSFVVNGNGEVAFSTFANLGQGSLTISGGATVFFPSGTVNSSRGQLLVNNGVIVGDNLRNSTQASSFGNPNDAARGVIRLGNAASSGTLRYTGTGNSSDRQFQIGNGSGSGGSQIEQNGASGVLTLSGTGTFFNAQDAAATSPRSLTLAGTNVNANTISGGIRDNTASGTVAIVKSGTGRWTLSGTNTYTGGTTVSGGTLVAAGPTSLPVYTTPGRVTVASGATLAVGSGFGDATIESLLGSGAFQAGSAIGFSTATSGYGYDRAVTGNIGVTKLDNNQLSLGGMNTYSGPTIVLGGTLLYTAPSAVSPDTAITNGATLAFANGAYTLTKPTTLSGDGVRTINVAGGSSLQIDNSISRSGTDNPILSINGDGTVVINGAIGDLGTNGTSFGRVGVNGTTSLLGLNAFRGTVNIDNGTLVVNTIRDGAPSSIGTGTIAGSVINPGLANTSGTLRYIGTENATTARQVRIGRDTGATATGGAILENAGTGSLTFSAPTFTSALSASDTAPRTLTIGGAGNGAIQGVISNNSVSSVISLTKAGTGTWRLAGTNTYTGPTTVSGGTLLIDGTNSGTGAITVASGATLGGTGQLAGATTVSGIHSPGASPGLQTFTNNLTYNATGSLIWELSGNTAETADRGTLYDGVNVTGASRLLTIDPAATLALVFDAPLANADPSTVNFTNAFWDSDRTWQVISLAGGATGNGNVFGTISVGADASGNVLATVRPQASFSLASQQDGVFLIYSAVPEPTTTALLVFGAASLVGVVARARRRRA